MQATRKKLIQTALQPVGTTLYVYGGGWNLQNTGGAVETVTIGPAASWRRFFLSQNADYRYDGCYYPRDGWNRFHAEGLDCSGYLGWVIYNTLCTENGKKSYVTASTGMARELARQGLGTWKQSYGGAAERFEPGDVVSLKGHVWLSLGTCTDGSVLLAHATPSESVTGGMGGGVQLSAINPVQATATDCEAYRLAAAYMKRHCPEWSRRYRVVLKPYAVYTAVQEGGSEGRFRWDPVHTLADPENFKDLTPERLLEQLEKEEQ